MFIAETDNEIGNSGTKNGGKKLEMGQSVLLPWIIKSGWHYTVEFTDQNTKAVFIAFQAES